MHVLPLPVTPIESSALISQCGTYRYTLHRRWTDGPLACWVMLNPSTADSTQDDPTIRRCISFSKGWEFGGLYVVNLFALRATNPRELYVHPDPVGPQNDGHIEDVVEVCDLVVAAWGVHGAFQNRGIRVRRLLGEVCHLGLTKGGHPRHPLYVKGDQTISYEWAS